MCAREAGSRPARLREWAYGDDRPLSSPLKNPVPFTARPLLHAPASTMILYSRLRATLSLISMPESGVGPVCECV